MAKIWSIINNNQSGYYIFQKITIILVIVGCTYVCLSNTVPAGRFSGQGQVVKFHLASVFCLVSERPVFKTWVVGLNLCPPRSGHCPECLEADVGRASFSRFTLICTISSGSQLAAFDVEFDLNTLCQLAHVHKLCTWVAIYISVWKTEWQGSYLRVKID